ncbi:MULTISPECIES: ureidoglycolate lyase [Burkholderia]|uniref:ureidoglycolate lyase n=1 Tax=Burkholderia TaxID=32008 RepID=UPI000327F2CF|nr:MULTISPECIES: ureidoglycolate lyase [Burkholderia]AGK46844.1 ureidoglycolate hydrolase family protein [Burkholderia thailandensis MSMB121]ATF35848.1 ureidoglycolate lyase [Burkholderia thailandensis]KST73251.1 ureidoglycolate hydrolase [Burkholderia humptydooensis]KVN14349.1 ureidoglycolate hydrolase [Burkholderia sp. MSMB1552]KWZ56972.1 ureidoglycolate hydrolase [Burkholderia sp. MSMB1588]
MQTLHTLRLERLTREAFAPFGDVIELAGARRFLINGGTTERFHDLASIDVTEGGGLPLVSLFRAQPRAWPIEVDMMERHPLGSQAFVPLAAVARYAIVVAPAGEFDPTRMRAFLAQGWQGVNYAKGVWHHPLLALDAVSDFVVIDRGGAQPNCDEIALDAHRRLVADDAHASAA